MYLQPQRSNGDFLGNRLKTTNTTRDPHHHDNDNPTNNARPNNEHD